MESMAGIERVFRRYEHQGIPPEAVEAIADALLAVSDKDADRPTYTEEQLDRRRRRQSRAEEYFAMLAAARGALPQQGCDVPPEAGLAEDECAAWEMFVAGYRASEIARALRISRPTAVRLIKTAARRISTCRSAFLGLGDVYRMEVHKRIYRKPSHCPEMPCRRLGYCKYSGQV